MIVQAGEAEADPSRIVLAACAKRLIAEFLGRNCYEGKYISIT